MELAISGKGGVGKTNIATALPKSLPVPAKQYTPLIDPDACLAPAIFVSLAEALQNKPVVERVTPSAPSRAGGFLYSKHQPGGFYKSFQLLA